MSILSGAYLREIRKVKIQTPQKHTHTKINYYYTSILLNKPLLFQNGSFAENPTYKVKDRLKHAAC